MNQDQFEAYTKWLLSQSADLLISKGAEYAGSEDRLSNFKRGATDTGASPEQVCWIYLSKHLDSLKTHIRTGKQGSEPIQGRIADAMNYIILLGALLHEKQAQREPTIKWAGAGLPSGCLPPEQA